MKKTILWAAVLWFSVLAAGCGSPEDPAVTADIGKNEASDLALSDAGVSEEDVTRLSVSREQEGGAVYYDIAFTCQGTEYTYEIQASDGLILKAEKEKNENGGEADSSVSPTPSVTEEPSPTAAQTPEPAPSSTASPEPAQTSPGTSAPEGAVISFEEAKQLALDRVPNANDAHIEMEFERDDGFLIYEGEIHYQRTEYEFEIDARTGNFIKWSEEHHGG